MSIGQYWQHWDAVYSPSLIAFCNPPQPRLLLYPPPLEFCCNSLPLPFFVSPLSTLFVREKDVYREAQAINNCSDRSMEVKLHALLGNYDRQTIQPTDQTTIQSTDGRTDQGHREVSLPIRRCMSFLCYHIHTNIVLS